MPLNEDIEQFLTESRLTLENAREPEVQQRVAAYGLDTDHVAEGLGLLEQAEAAYAANKQEYRDKSMASDTYRNAFAAFQARYVRHVKLLRVAFSDRPAAFQDLGLGGERRRQQKQLLADAAEMYTILASDPELLEVAAEVNVTAEDVQASLDALAEVRDLLRARRKETYTAEASTASRDDVVADLRGWMSDFWSIAEVALEPDPQLKEMLGRTAPSQ
jgi:hypothetical protein